MTPEDVRERLRAGSVRQHLARTETTLARANGHALGTAPTDTRGGA